MNRNKKVMRFESKKDQNEKKKTHFAIQESHFHYNDFLVWFLGFAFQKMICRACEGTLL
jgi:hypothetical protein